MSSQRTHARVDLTELHSKQLPRRRSSLRAITWLAASLTVAAAAAFGRSSPYLEEMPTAATVLTDYEGGERLEALARQYAALELLFDASVSLAQELSGLDLNHGALLPEEKARNGDYRTAQGQILTDAMAALGAGERCNWQLGAPCTVWHARRAALARDGEFAREVLTRYLSPPHREILLRRVEKWPQGPASAPFPSNYKAPAKPWSLNGALESLVEQVPVWERRLNDRFGTQDYSWLPKGEQLLYTILGVAGLSALLATGAAVYILVLVVRWVIAGFLSFRSYVHRTFRHEFYSRPAYAVIGLSAAAVTAALWLLVSGYGLLIAGGFAILSVAMLLGRFAYNIKATNLPVGAVGSVLEWIAVLVTGSLAVAGAVVVGGLLVAMAAVVVAGLAAPGLLAALSSNRPRI